MPEKQTQEKPKVKLAVGDLAPDFNVKVQYAEQNMDFNLAKKLKEGQKVLLIFYPGDDTPGCTKQLCGVQEVYAEYTKAGVFVLGINHAKADSHQKFIQKFGYNFGIAIDEDKTIREKYGAVGSFFGKPTTKRGVFLINTDGKIAFIHWGQQDNAKVLEIAKSLV